VVEVVISENPLQQRWVLSHLFAVKLNSIAMREGHQAADVLGGRIVQKHHPLYAPLRRSKRVLPGANRNAALMSNLRIGLGDALKKLPLLQVFRRQPRRRNDVNDSSPRMIKNSEAVLFDLQGQSILTVSRITFQFLRKAIGVKASALLECCPP